MNAKECGWSVILLIFLAGCSYKFAISITAEDPFRPTLEFNKPVLVRPFGSGVPLNRLTVVQHKETGWDYQHPLWSIRSDSGRAIPIQRLAYGDLPAGFTQDDRAEQLQAGIRYRVEGMASGGVGSIEFEIVGSQGSYRLLVDAIETNLGAVGDVWPTWPS